MPDLYTRFIAGVVFPLQEKLKRHDTVRVRRDLETTQWWPPERLRALQLQRLQRLLSHAQEHVPYYRDMFNRLGFEARAVTALEDLRQLPLLTKADIREHCEAMKSGHAQGLARFNTGGSSGQPLVFWIGKERVTHDVAAKWRATRWWDVDIGDREMVVWGSPIELSAQDRVRRFRDKLMRTRLLPAFEMSEAKLDRFVAAIRAVRPRMLFGYPSALAHIARHAQARCISLDGLGIRVAFVTSERLYDHQRQQIETVFGCPVANGYGGRDAGFIAHQCPAGGMHLTAEDCIVEIVDSRGSVLPPGQAGEVVVTHLATPDFPFIRYRTGDVAVLDDAACACGRGLPMLKEIQGRTTDFVLAADGTVMHGLALIYVIRDLPGVENFKIIQESSELTRVQLVTAASFREADIEAIRQGLSGRLGGNVRIEIERVSRIEAEGSGKFRFVVSRIAPGM